MIPDYLFHHLLKDKELGQEVVSQIKASRKLSKKLRKARKLIDSVPGVAELFTYNLKNDVADNLPGDLVRREDEILYTDERVEEAHENHKVVRAFLAEVLNRNSYDGKGGDLHGSVHVEEGLDNAFWTGVQMAYGDGLIFKAFTKSLTVSAHEIFHGLQQSICNLQYFWMSGALNEAIADIGGITCRHWHEKTPILEANWLVGDDLVTERFPGKAVRSFKNEKAYSQDPQPKHMKNFVWTFKDNMGVHENSGIILHAYYTFCTNYAEVVEDAKSWEAPIQIFYKAISHLYPLSTFWDYKNATLKVCKLNYVNLLPALEDAWKTVGV